MTAEHPPSAVGRGGTLDDRTVADAVVVTYQPAGRSVRREVFVPRASDGPDWERVEQARSADGTWRTVGSELVDAVAVEQ